MLDSDGRTEQQVHTAIEWSQSHEFWRGNILSMPKLREKYITLQEQAKRKTPNGQNGAGAPADGKRVRPRDEHRHRR